MGDTLIMIIAIATGVVLMFVFPLMQMANRTDDVTQLTVQSAVRDMVKEACNTGELTPEMYDQCMQVLAGTGNVYELEFEIKVLDENPGKKSTQVQLDKIGENMYYTVTTPDVLDKVSPDSGTPKPYVLKEGDIIVARATMANQSLAQQLETVWLQATNQTPAAAASEAGMVLTTGK